MAKPDRAILLEEYKLRATEITNRGSQTLSVQSIISSASLVVATFAVSQRQQLGKGILIPVPLVSEILLLDVIPPLIALIFQLTSMRLDNIAQQRLGEIEDSLGMANLREKFLNSWWYKLRTLVWPFNFVLLMTLYMAGSIVLAISQ